MLADLHVHTNASDGTSSPAEVVRMAARAGLRAIAITDHDTMDGVPAALAEAGRYEIDVLGGVELSTEQDGLEVHVLGYCIDPAKTTFQEYLDAFKNARFARAEKMVHKLRQLGVNISFDSVLELAGTGSVGRPHIARALLNEGKINKLTEAFDKYIGFGKAAYVPRLKFRPEEMIRAVIEAGGVPVLAHPGITCGDDLIRFLIRNGLQGVEVCHPKHAPDIEEHYRSLCRSYGLIATGGSDYHGAGVTGHGNLGDAVVHYGTVAELRQQAAQNSRK
ncbi:MAG: PHP domain-containing protein [Firmicutes bacterium]|nr:PHP domain-containing protein [Bacillota bacterium]